MTDRWDFLSTTGKNVDSLDANRHTPSSTRVQASCPQLLPKTTWTSRKLSKWALSRQTDLQTKICTIQYCPMKFSYNLSFKLIYNTFCHMKLLICVIYLLVFFMVSRFRVCLGEARVLKNIFSHVFLFVIFYNYLIKHSGIYFLYTMWRDCDFICWPATILPPRLKMPPLFTNQIQILFMNTGMTLHAVPICFSLCLYQYHTVLIATAMFYIW